MPFPRRFAPGVMIALTVAGLMAACSHPAPATTVPVSSGKSASLRVAGGLEVTIPAGAVTHAGTLSGSVITAPTAAPRGMTLSGPVYDLNLTGTVLRGHADLTVPVPASRGSGISAGPNAALLVYYDAAAGRWQPAVASYNPATRALSAAVGHLSVWSVLQFNPQQVLAAAASALKGFFGVADSAQPACPGSGRLTALGVKATSDPGDLVRWCADDSGTGAVLRIASNRSYAMEADYRSDWSASLAGSLDPITAAILKSLPALSLKAGGPGVSTTIIPGGQELDVTAQGGTSGIVLLGPSVEGIIIDALRYAADTVAMTFGDVPGAPHPAAQTTGKAIAMTLADAECVSQMDAVIKNPDLSTPQAAGAIFGSLTGIAASCLGKYWPSAYGISGSDAALIVGAVLWLADGIKLIVSDGHALVDGAVYWQGYHINLQSISGAAPPCTSAVLSSALRAANVPLLVPENWVVTGYACQSGYALAELGGTGYPVDAIFRQQGSSWAFAYVLGESDSCSAEQNGIIVHGCEGGPSQALLQSLMQQASRAAGPVTASLPVVSCPTSDGAGLAPVSLPQSRAVAVPQALAAGLSLYADTQGVMELLGPKGWNCTAAIGADGSGGVTVYPRGAGPASPVAITGSETSACVGCTLGQACVLFTSAAAALRSELGEPCPVRPPAAETTASIAPGIEGFEDPPGVKGDGQPSGGQYRADGVMTYHPSAPDGSWQETCTLPASELDVCTAVLNTFVSWYGQR